ncbi:MAG: glycoside hydrolase family 15 protein [Pirellulales bacterium]
MVGQPKINDYAAIGDGRSVALISRGGSIDWLCWPRFDCPSLFGAILDPRIGGSWSIAPAQPAQIERRYIEGTNVLATRFRTATGTVVLTDFMPATSEEQKRTMLWPEHELVRRVECEQGEIEIQSHFDPRPDFGRAKVRIREMGALGLRLETESGLITLRSDVSFGSAKEGGLTARARLTAGEAVAFSLAFAAEGPAVLAPLGELVGRKLALTTEWWQRWSARATYHGPYREQVVRSALALKLLIYAPSGAMIAAPTTSLPTCIGGGENWDYRYCWLRDAAFTARSLFGLGFVDEAKAFVSWMLHATRLTRPRLQVLYDVFGGDRSKESMLSHLAGYAGSQPVRVGNHAGIQFQLDPYGEVIEAVTHFVKSGGELDRETQKMLRQFGEYVCRNWHKPDNGIWEDRAPGRHYTYSRLMCWVALDRLLEMHDHGHVRGLPIEQFMESRRQIRRDIEDRGWNPNLECYTQLLDGETLDTSVLLMAAHLFDVASSQRMQRTHRRIRERLSPAPGLLYRKEQSLKMGEGAFGISCFWDVDFLARGGGSVPDAHDAFTRTAAYANDLGLFAEQIDPKTGDALGNFPQAFTHVGLINAALSLAERETGRSASPVDPGYSREAAASNL